jgi:ABC-type branched-subunit amino acid transport system substrate-binding protein
MPQNHYSFLPVFMNTGSTGMEGWFAKTYPNVKTMVVAVPDNPMGQMSAGKTIGQFSAFGITPTIETYPATSTDLSSLGTKIKVLNPDSLFATVGSGQPYAAAYNAGWRGVMFSGTATTAQELLTQMTPEMTEGLIGGALPTEWDPPKTAYAKEFKDAWIARFGKWDPKDYNSVGCFDCLIAGLKKANSLDTDKVAAAIGSGLDYETAQGPGKMISRPDLGNDRTVDSVLAWIMKKIHNGQPEYVTTISIEDSLAYFRTYTDFIAQHPEMAGGPPH